MNRSSCASRAASNLVRAGRIDVRAGQSAVIVKFRHRDPTLPALTLDEGESGFALRIERVEFLAESSSVDLRV